MALKDLVELRENAAKKFTRRKLIDSVRKKTFVFRKNLATGKGEPAEIDGDKIAQVAQAMEAALVMADAMPDDTMIRVDARKDEVMHFVHYTRELDKQYRLLEAEVTELRKMDPRKVRK